ncbi:NrfD/PsrC family molybdoenzyme membrane anchor subunit [Amycolatopsis sp.]|uniref:NrfD/PsrC family molybdoenzyme membrane anchor subunit n=1 Tax=Amycolatopsis sp. TaxID=37632 RepID=UPI002B6C124D|nr:NrfD/PsrC family molybdoenzyme membrane anchor subunit [Amycolatopsis sp.]HVV08305.1 NrfD/PsrC family molybdoenzyme membrane anchor subunit [Amycolatopsis sp.]
MTRPGREALTGVATGRKRRRGEQPMVPDAKFTSYYGKPVINGPVWQAPDIPGYLFLGGLAGASSLLGAGAQATGRPAIAAISKTGAFGAVSLSLVALVHDLGRPARFLNMLRVLKVTSPMSVGSWLLTAYGPLAGAAAFSAVTGRFRRIGTAATAGSTVLGPAVAAYTAALLSDTAVPAWHDGHRELPYVFVGSGATAAGGLALLAAPTTESGPARTFAVFGVALENGAFKLMERRMGMVAEPYRTGRGGKYVHAAEILSAAGAAGALLARRNHLLRRLSGAALVAASAALRWGVFHAGKDSAADPKYTIVPQRHRADARAGRPE